MVEVHWFVGLEALRPALQIRREVFCQEQGYQVDQDDTDAAAIHALLTQGEEPIGTGASTWTGTARPPGRIAVRKAYGASTWAIC